MSYKLSTPNTDINFRDADVIRGINFALSFTLSTLKRDDDDDFLRLALTKAAGVMHKVQKHSPIEGALLDVDFHLNGDTPWES